METWRPVNGYEGLYEVSDQGRVRSLDHVTTRKDGRTQRVRGRMRKIVYSSTLHGYGQVSLTKNGVTTPTLIHRIVADAFIPKHTGNEVNHKDGNKSNNCATNLEWVTHSDNIRHAYRTGLKTASYDIDRLKNISQKGANAIKRSVEMCDLNGNVIRTYDSAYEARFDGFIPQLIGKCCARINKSHKGYMWRYARKEENNV